MLKVLDYVKQANRTTLTLDNGGDGQLLQIFPDGTLEQYMGAFGLEAGAALTLILADAHIDGIESPLMGEPDISNKIRSVLSGAKGQIEWAIDRDQLLADMTLADDTAEMVKNTWAEVAQQSFQESTTAEEDLRERMERNRGTAEGYQRIQQERLADEIVSSMPSGKRGMPRNTESSSSAPVAVGLAIEFIP